MQLTSKELLKNAEHRVYVDHLGGNVPNAVHDLCNEAEILVNAAMDSDVMLALAAYEAGRVDALRLLEARGSSWVRSDGRWSVSGFEGTGEESMIEYLELLKTNSKHDILSD